MDSQKKQIPGKKNGKMRWLARKDEWKVALIVGLILGGGILFAVEHVHVVWGSSRADVSFIVTPTQAIETNGYDAVIQGSLLAVDSSGETCGGGLVPECDHTWNANFSAGALTDLGTWMLSHHFVIVVRSGNYSDFFNVTFAEFTGSSASAQVRGDHFILTLYFTPALTPFMLSTKEVA